MTTTADLYVTEHAQGLHTEFAPSGCQQCSADFTARTGMAVPPRLEPEPNSDFTSLGDAIERIRQRRGGKLFGDGQPPDPEPPQAADGNPWCESCAGARMVAIREDRTLPRYTRCPDCLHASWAIQQRVDRLLGSLPPRFAEWRLDTFPSTDFQQKRALEIVKSWIEAEDSSWIFLWGPTGRGKTGLAVGVLHELALRGQSTALRNVPDLLTTIKSTFSQDGDESESSILEVLAAVDVLCMDDLGAEYHRGREDWAAEKVFQIVASRHAALKRTIITSNYSLEQLQDILGHPRTLRRIVDMTGARWIVDFRRLPQIGAGS